MSWDQQEIEELKLDEGFRSKPYKDTLGVWTIGYGWTHGVNENTPECTEAEAEEWLRSEFEDDIKECTEHIDCFAGLDGPRKGALCNMAYQLGAKKLSTFHQFLGLLDLGKYEEAAEDLAHTLWYKQTPNRAKRIAYRIRTGEYFNRVE